VSFRSSNEGYGAAEVSAVYFAADLSSKPPTLSLSYSLHMPTSRTSDTFLITFCYFLPKRYRYKLNGDIRLRNIKSVTRRTTFLLHVSISSTSGFFGAIFSFFFFRTL
jgi:hypothetical protein